VKPGGTAVDAAEHAVADASKDMVRAWHWIRKRLFIKASETSGQQAAINDPDHIIRNPVTPAPVEIALGFLNRNSCSIRRFRR
jgi:hypothetical protein